MGLKVSQRPQTIPTSSDPNAMNDLLILPLAGPAKGYERAARLVGLPGRFAHPYCGEAARPSRISG